VDDVQEEKSRLADKTLEPRKFAVQLTMLFASHPPKLASVRIVRIALDDWPLDVKRLVA